VVEVRIEGYRLDVFEGFDFSFNYGIADIRNPEKRSTEYSKTIKCPATKNNDQLFGHIYDVNISNYYDANTTNISVNFNPNKKAEARVIADGVEVMAGVVQLRKIVQKGHAYTYEVVFIGKLLNIFSVLGDKELNGVDENGDPFIDFSDLNHAYNYTNITDSWNFTEDYVYPLIDWAHSFDYNSQGQRIYRVKSFKPFLKLKSVVNRIFDFAGFTYNSNFFDSSLFDRLIIGDAKDSKLSDAQVALRDAKVNIGGSYNMLDNLQPVLQGQYHIWDYQTIEYDGGNNFIPSSKIYLSNYQTIATVSSVVEYEITRVRQSFYHSNSNASAVYRFDYLANGNVDVYNNDTGALINGNVSRSQPIAALTGDGQAGVQVGPLINPNLDYLVNVLRANESYRDQLISVNNWQFFFGFDLLYGQLQPVWSHNARMNSNVLGYTFLNENPYSFPTQVNIAETVYSTSTASAEGVEIFNSDWVYTEVYIPDSSFTAGYLKTVFADEFDVVPNGYFQIETENEGILEHQELDFQSLVPDVEMSELLTSIFKMFNLYVEVDPNNERNLLIETRDTFYSQGGTKDWTYKLARDKDVTLEPLGVLTDREYIYTYSEDGDYYNERYQNNRGHAYGRARIEVDNDFVQSSKEVDVIFSPSPLVNDSPSNRIIPAIWDADIDDGVKPTDTNIRILQWGGNLPSNPNWEFKHLPPPPLNVLNGLITTAITTYPYAGHWDNPISPTIDINFGLPLELYYQANGFTGTLQVTNANLYNIYHRNYINEVTDKDSKVMTAMFYLEPTDINKLDFREQIVIDNAYWRLNKVMNYNPFKEGLTKVELIKIKEAVTFKKSDRSLNAGGYLGKEKMPSPSTEIKTNGNKYPSFQGKVSGAENNVGQSVTAFKVVGSRNSIGEGSKNITIFGNDNQVAGGLHNVQLINTNGVIVTQSNTTYINGKEQDNVEVLEGGLNEVRALNGGTNIFTVDGGEDIVQTQFSEIAIYTIEGGVD
jgi:hypothetical protein